MGNFHVTGWDPERKVLKSAFTVRREYCHTNGTIAQGGFITAWLDASMAHAVLHDTAHAKTVFSLEIKVSFYEKVGPGEGWVEARVIRRGKRVTFLEASLYNADRHPGRPVAARRPQSRDCGLPGRRWAQGTSTGAPVVARFSRSS
jgi:acyl-coenzyme A thioesterase PaaI-like protein